MMKLPRKRERVRSGIERAPQREWPRHRKFIRSLTCSVPGCIADHFSVPTECAHIRHETDGGTSMKPSDWWTISLCSWCHASQHAMGEPAFEAKHKINMKAIAMALAKQSPDTAMREAMKEAGAMTLTPDEAAVERVADAILAELSDRKGIGDAFDSIDDEIMAEIKQAIGCAALAAAAPAPGDAWRDDMDAAPRDGTTIQVYRYVDPWHVVGYAHWVDMHGIAGWISYSYGEIPGNLGLAAPTHWQPLPEPPK